MSSWFGDAVAWIKVYKMLWGCAEWMEIQAVIWKEEDMFIIKEVVTGVTTQGKTIEEALENLKEALQLYLEEVPEAREELSKRRAVGTIYVEIT